MSTVYAALSLLLIECHFLSLLIERESEHLLCASLVHCCLANVQRSYSVEKLQTLFTV